MREKTSLDEAVKILNQGGIVIYPTDTAFGIGCRIDKEESIRKLFKIRNRPKGQAVPVLFDSKERVLDYLLGVNKKVENLMDEYWPGALTLVLNCKVDKVPEAVRGGGKTLGVRIPDHKAPLSLIKEIDSPILGPSANFRGEKTPFTFEELDKSLIKLVDYILKGKTKGSKKASTVVNCTTYPWKIIRQGEILSDI